MYLFCTLKFGNLVCLHTLTLFFVEQGFVRNARGQLGVLAHVDFVLYGAWVCAQRAILSFVAELFI